MNAAYQIERATTASRIGAVFALLAVAVLISVPWWGESSWMRTLVEFGCLLVLAQMWNLLAGYGGVVSIGQQAYLGLGAYALFVLADDVGLNPFVCIPLAGVVRGAARAFPRRRWCSGCTADTSRSAPGWSRRSIAC